MSLSCPIHLAHSMTVTNEPFEGAPVLPLRRFFKWGCRILSYPSTQEMTYYPSPSVRPPSSCLHKASALWFSCYPIAPSATFFTASQGWTFHAGPFSPWLTITASSPLLPYYSDFKNCIDSANSLPVCSAPCLISNKLILQPSSATHSHGSTPDPRPGHLPSL